MASGDVYKSEMKIHLTKVVSFSANIDGEYDSNSFDNVGYNVYLYIKPDSCYELEDKRYLLKSFVEEEEARGFTTQLHNLLGLDINDQTKLI